MLLNRNRQAHPLDAAPQPAKGESMTKPDDLIARAKAAIANHKTYVAEQGGIILSGGMMPELVERVESLEAEVARLRMALQWQVDQPEAHPFMAIRARSALTEPEAKA